jgi:hypothetical protein
MATIERLEVELERIRKREARRREASRRDDEKAQRIREAIHRLRLASLVGVAGAVRIQFRRPAGDKWEWLNDLPGTIKQVRRLWAVVDFNGQEVNVPMENLIRVEQPQGLFVPL